jgi:uncharacterized membrane protein YfcA
MSLVGVWLAFLIPAQISGWLFAALLLVVIVQMALRRVTPRD